MAYHRLWFDRDQFGLTLGGGKINNPGRYRVLLPPINGATAALGTPYFTENPGDQYKAHDTSVTFDWMPRQYITWRWEYNCRAASVPYFFGLGGVTPPGRKHRRARFVCAGMGAGPGEKRKPDYRSHSGRLLTIVEVETICGIRCSS
ncbi:MAG TPA: hypothetical protein VMA71_02890 [Alloacidobacterium sp.]|nr:hypothetical protein [Alloacidobacterium sp.]